jgi:hypothetical protein
MPVGRRHPTAPTASSPEAALRALTRVLGRPLSGFVAASGTIPCEGGDLVRDLSLPDGTWLPASTLSNADDRTLAHRIHATPRLYAAYIGRFEPPAVENTGDAPITGLRDAAGALGVDRKTLAATLARLPGDLRPVGYGATQVVWWPSAAALRAWWVEVHTPRNLPIRPVTRPTQPSSHEPPAAKSLRDRLRGLTRP